MKVLPTLQAKTVSWILTGTLAGLITGVLWNGSQQAWERYLDHAEYTGQQLYGALQNGAPLPAELFAVEVVRTPAGSDGSPKLRSCKACGTRILAARGYWCRCTTPA